MPVKLNKNAIERHEVIEIHFPVAQCALRAAIYRFVHFVSGRATARSKTPWSAGSGSEYRERMGGAAEECMGNAPMLKRGPRSSAKGRRGRLRFLAEARAGEAGGRASVVVVGRFRQVLRESLTGTLTLENRGRRARLNFLSKCTCCTAGSPSITRAKSKRKISESF